MCPPIVTPDYTPDLAQIQVVDGVCQGFAGSNPLRFLKQYAAAGLKYPVVTGETGGDDALLRSFGDEAIGLYSCCPYTLDLDTPSNKRFVAAWKKDYGADSTPDFVAIGGYDGIAAIVHAAKALKGKMDDGDKAVAALKGWKFNSPQGPISVDPDTRDIVMNEYLSEVVKGKDGKLHMKVLATIDHVKDVCKAQKIGPCANVAK